MDQEGVVEHTGFPNPATDSRLASLDIRSLLIKHPASTFFMTIDGHGWERYGIFHGDIAIIDRSLSPRSGDMIVWWDGSNFTINRLSAGRFTQPIWGVITNIVHRYRP